jgi:hypothetical protein
MKRQVDEEVKKLRGLADRDGSGFVSTTEGLDFRKLIEFGYLVAQVAADGGRGPDAVATAAGIDVAVAETKLHRLAELSKRFEAAGFGPLQATVRRLVTPSNGMPPPTRAQPQS